MRPQSTTLGIPLHQFDTLVTRVTAHEATRTARADGAHRTRPPSVPVATALHITLLYLRQNVVQVFLGQVFGISQSTVSRVLAWGRPVVAGVVEPAVVGVADVPATERIVVDGALVPTGNRAGHRELYSGKRHRSGVGIQVLCDRWGKLVEVVGHVPGKTHDARAWFDLGVHEVLAERVVLGDLGYLGCTDESVGVTVVTPTRKPRGKALTIEQQVDNYAHNSKRVVVERAIAQLKKWRVLSGGYRGPLKRIGETIRAVVALEKLRTHIWPL